MKFLNNRRKVCYKLKEVDYLDSSLSEFRNSYLLYFYHSSAGLVLYKEGEIERKGIEPGKECIGSKKKSLSVPTVRNLVPSSGCGVHSTEPAVGFQVLISPVFCKIIAGYPQWAAKHHAAAHSLPPLQPATGQGHRKGRVKARAVVGQEKN